MYAWSPRTLTRRLQYFGIQFTNYIGVISFPSFNITLNGMDSGIMDGWGQFLPSIPKDLLVLAGVIKEDLCQAGHVVDASHLFVQYQVR